MRVVAAQVLGQTRRYLDAGIDVNWKDHMGWAALHLACRQKETAISQLLIERGWLARRALFRSHLLTHPGRRQRHAGGHERLDTAALCSALG